uniref:Uncharacterized protein n=1 Tax=Cacopsylla melanoneura TaxID=428564 RepID=A0A8D8T8Y4_9HEMI
MHSAKEMGPSEFSVSFTLHKTNFMNFLKFPSTQLAFGQIPTIKIKTRIQRPKLQKQRFIFKENCRQEKQVILQKLVGAIGFFGSDSLNPQGENLRIFQDVRSWFFLHARNKTWFYFEKKRETIQVTPCSLMRV